MDSCSDDFSLVIFKDGTQKLLWRDQDGAHSMWRKTDSSPDYIKPHILTVALKKGKANCEETPRCLWKGKASVPTEHLSQIGIVDCRTTAEKKAKGI